MNNNDGKFSAGFLMGIIIGGGLVFLLGTKTGKNLLKIISEQGMDGISNLLEEYDIEDDLEEYEETEREEESDLKEHINKKEQGEKQNLENAPSKKRFFKRIRR